MTDTCNKATKQRRFIAADIKSVAMEIGVNKSDVKLFELDCLIAYTIFGLVELLIDAPRHSFNTYAYTLVSLLYFMQWRRNVQRLPIIPKELVIICITLLKNYHPNECLFQFACVCG
jgi:hypothetical protein